MRALLEQELSRANLTFPQWTALVFTSTIPLPISQVFQRQLAGHVIATESEAQHSLSGMLSAGLLSEDGVGTVSQTDSGRELFASLSKAVDSFTSALYGDLPPADLEATHRTLLEIAARATKLLASRGC
jgi:DNA-binding MarR family transcriptional regulator